ncbi:hypothetical protein A2U01_0074368, partial [Trifolium medium]|nr:hypothetical protein [Trifolium medium]
TSSWIYGQLMTCNIRIHSRHLGDVQANRSAFSLRQAFSCFLAGPGSPVPIFTPLPGSSPNWTSSNSPSGMGR